MRILVKDPDAELDYTIDWASDPENGGPWLDDGEAIATSEFLLPDGITEGEDDKASSNTDQTATVWLSGGTDGTAYKVTNRIVTSAGRTADKSFMVSIRQR